MVQLGLGRSQEKVGQIGVLAKAVDQKAFSLRQIGHKLGVEWPRIVVSHFTLQKKWDSMVKSVNFLLSFKIFSMLVHVVYENSPPPPKKVSKNPRKFASFWTKSKKKSKKFFIK